MRLTRERSRSLPAPRVPVRSAHGSTVALVVDAPPAPPPPGPPDDPSPPLYRAATPGGAATATKGRVVWLRCPPHPRLLETRPRHGEGRVADRSRRRGVVAAASTVDSAAARGGSASHGAGAGCGSEGRVGGWDRIGVPRAATSSDGATASVQRCGGASASVQRGGRWGGGEGGICGRPWSRERLQASSACPAALGEQRARPDRPGAERGAAPGVDSCSV